MIMILDHDMDVPRVERERERDEQGDGLERIIFEKMIAVCD